MMRGKSRGSLKPLKALPGLLLLGTIVLGGPTHISAQSLRRIPSDRLEVPIPGFAVIGDTTAWRILWDRFARPRRMVAGDTLELVRRPQVHFADSILIAIAPGGFTGCSNALRMVDTIREYPDSVVVSYSTTGILTGVEVGAGGVYITCQAYFTPIDIVAIRRTSAPIIFRPYQTDSPLPAAPWWDRPSIAALDSMPPGQRVVYLDALAMDPSVHGRYLVEVARRPMDGYAAQALLSRPEVRGDWRALRTLSGHGDELQREARRLIIDLHGVSVAADRAAPRDLLELLIGDLMEHPSEPGWSERRTQRLRRANALLRNQTVLGDVELLQRMTYATQFLPEMHTAACRVYLRRYPDGREMVSGDGQKYRVAPNCPVQ